MQNARRELSAKIVYYGPGLSGKTTNLQFIHSHLPDGTTGKLVSMTTRTDRTLFFDYLPVDLGEVDGRHTRFLLYTVPGQVYYNATRKLVLKDADAIVFVADSSASQMDANVESMRNLEENLQEYGVSLRSIPWVIQYNKRDLEDAVPVIDLHKKLNPLGVPAFEATATAGVGVYETLQGIAMRLHSALTARAMREKAEGVANAALIDADDVTTAVDDALREVGEGKTAAKSDTSSLGFDIEHDPTSEAVRIAPADDTTKSDDNSGFITDPMRPKREGTVQPRSAPPAPAPQVEFEEKTVDLEPSKAEKPVAAAPIVAARAPRPAAPAPVKPAVAAPVAPTPPPRVAAPGPKPPVQASPSPSAHTSAVAAPAPPTHKPPAAPIEIHVPVTLSPTQIRKAVPIKIVLDIQVDDE